MTLPLTPETLAAAYDYLNTTPPFSRWNLPESEDVVFRVVRDRAICGTYQWDGGRHVVSISRSRVGRTQSLVETMAHEMIHLHEEHAQACGRGEHSAAFNRWAGQVCKAHGFDPKLF